MGPHAVAGRRTALLATLAGAATGVQVGVAMVASRFVIEQTTPGALAMMRYAIGFLCLLPIVLAQRRVRFERRDLLPIALLGITQFGILVALLNYGLQFIPAAQASLIFALLPLLTMSFAAAMGLERLNATMTIGVVLTIAGVAIALDRSPSVTVDAAGHWTGSLAVLLATVSGALCSVLYRPYLRRYPTVSVSAFAMLASVAFLVPIAAGEGFFAGPPPISPAGWLAVAFIGVSSGVGYFLWLWALNHATPTKVTVFLGLSPVTAALLGAWILNEPVSVALWVGIACVMAGLWITHRPSDPAKAKTPLAGKG